MAQLFFSYLSLSFSPRQPSPSPFHRSIFPGTILLLLTVKNRAHTPHGRRGQRAPRRPSESLFKPTHGLSLSPRVSLPRLHPGILPFPLFFLCPPYLSGAEDKSKSLAHPPTSAGEESMPRSFTKFIFVPYVLYIVVGHQDVDAVFLFFFLG